MLKKFVVFHVLRLVTTGIVRSVLLLKTEQKNRSFRGFEISIAEQLREWRNW